MNATSRYFKIYVVLVLGFLFLPNLFIVMFSFNSSPLTKLPLEALSLRWYRTVLNDTRFFNSLENSLWVALRAVLASITIGTMAAFAIARHRRRWPILNVLLALAMAPIMLPGLVLGIALLSLYSVIDLKLSLWTVTISHTLICLPYVLLIVTARLYNFDFRIEEASRDLGATAWQTFRYVTFPLARPSIIGAVLLVTALSLDEFIVTFFTIGGQITLPMFIWSELSTTVLPTLNVVATLLIGTSALMTFVAVRWAGVRL
jgi:spermidine/putrescine transport system permease protein